MRKQLSLSQAGMAQRMCFSRNYISMIENGHEPSQRFVRELDLLERAPVLNSERSEVVGEVSGGISEMSEGDEPGQSSISTRMIPLLSWAQAGTAQGWENLDEHERFAGFDVSDPKAVAVRIRGDAMEPHFPHGTIAIVYTGREAKSGDLVIARLKDGTVIFKRFHVDGTYYTFISTNPIYPPQTVEKSKVEMVLPVGGTFQSHL